MDKSPQPEALFKEITQFVTESRALIAGGAMLELEGLDGRVRELCDMVLRLSQEQRIHYADKLQELLGDLKELGETLVEQRDTVAQEIRGIAQHKKANVAYRTVEAIDAPKEEE